MLTTLRPQLGVVSHKGREFVVADIPGLIGGAADGAGVGDRSSAISNAAVLLHVVDAMTQMAQPVIASCATSWRPMAPNSSTSRYRRFKIDTLATNWSRRCPPELAEESGHPVMALSGASGAAYPRYLTNCSNHRPRKAQGGAGRSRQRSGETADWSPI